MVKDVTKKVRLEVYERDGGMCRLCKRQGEHIHHIIPRSRAKSLINEPSNLIVLCASCHNLVHSNMKYWIPYLKELNDGKN